MPVLHQPPAAIVATTLALLALAGCAGTSRTAGPAAPKTPPSSAPATPPPATVPPPSTPPSTTAPPSTTPVEVQHTTSQLKKALLALADLPAGFQVEPADGTDGGVQATSAQAACAPLVHNIQSDRPVGSVANAVASFSGGQDGPTIDESLDNWSSSTQATAYVASFRKAVLACSEVQLQIPGVGRSTVSVRPISFGQVGDSLFAARLSAPPGPLDGLEVVQVGAQTGNVVVGMSFTSTDPSDAQSATEDAVKKVQSELNTASTTS